MTINLLSLSSTASESTTHNVTIVRQMVKTCKTKLHFDQFELIVIEKTRFLKLPTNQDELDRTLEQHGDNFRVFLERLEMRLFQEGIIGEVLTEDLRLTTYGDSYFQIIQEIPQLDNDSATSVQSQLSRMGDIYRQIVD